VLSSYGRFTSVCLFVIQLPLLKTKYVTYIYDYLVYVFHEVFFIISYMDGILRVSYIFIECLWVAPHTLGVMVMSGLTFRPVALSVWINGLHLLVS
jgi:hypothetical protein